MPLWKLSLRRAAKTATTDKHRYIQGVPKTDTQFWGGDNFGNSAPILTILSLLQAPF